MSPKLETGAAALFDLLGLVSHTLAQKWDCDWKNYHTTNCLQMEKKIVGGCCTTDKWGRERRRGKEEEEEEEKMVERAREH